MECHHIVYSLLHRYTGDDSSFCATSYYHVITEIKVLLIYYAMTRLLLFIRFNKLVIIT